MKEYRYELSSEDQKKLFFWSWYHAPQLRWQRLLAGPSCLALSILFFLHRASGSYYLVGMLLAVVGLFYLYRPFLAFHRTKHEGLSASFGLTGSELRYRDAENESTIPASAMVSLSEGGRYAYLGVKLDKMMYIPLDLDRVEGRAEFLEKLRRMAGIE